MSGIDGIHWLHYVVPTRLSFNADNTVASILAQIPFDCVGIFGIGAITLFLYLSLLDRLSICLFSSTLLAFIGAIFDLAQLLARGRTASDNNTSLDLVQGLINFREVALAMSLSLRLVWFAAFVIKKVHKPSNLLGTAPVESNPFAWRRFGLFGVVFQWFLALVIAAVFALQILWRVDSTFSHTGPVYYTSAGLEVGLSVVFLLKLLLNIYLLDPELRWSVWRTYTVPAIAWMFGTAVAIANMTYFALSETTLGRFLQAVELYLLIVWTLAHGYSKTPNVGPRIPDQPPVLPMNIQRGSTMRLSLPTTSSPDVVQIQDPPSFLQSRDNRRSRRSRPSMLSRSSLASFIPGRRISHAATPYHADDERLWTQDQAEQGLSPIVVNEKMSARTSEDQSSPMEAKQSAKWIDPMFSTVMSESPEQVDDIRMLADTQPFALYVVNTPTGADSILNEGPDLDDEFRPPPMPNAVSRLSRASSSTIEWKPSVQAPAENASSENATRPTMPTASLSSFIASYQRRSSIGNAPEPLQPPQMLGVPSSTVRISPGLDSPVYGLDGFRTPSSMRMPSASTLSQAGSSVENRRSFMRLSDMSNTSSDMDLDEALRRQQELDRSIEKLKISASVNTLGSSPLVGDVSSASGPSYMSGSSDVSLGQFPAPPWLRRSLVPTGPRPGLGQTGVSDNSINKLLKRRSRSVDSIDELVAPRMPATMADRHARQVSVPDSLVPSFGVSPDDLTAINNRSPKFTSQGTEYEITSFIGGLTAGEPLPASPKEPSPTRYIQSTTRSNASRGIVVDTATLPKRPNVGNRSRQSSLGYIRARDEPLGPGSPSTAVSPNLNSDSPRSARALRNEPSIPRIRLPDGPASLKKDKISLPRIHMASPSSSSFEQPRKAPRAPGPL